MFLHFLLSWLASGCFPLARLIYLDCVLFFKELNHCSILWQHVRYIHAVGLIKFCCSVIHVPHGRFIGVVVINKQQLSKARNLRLIERINDWLFDSLVQCVALYSDSCKHANQREYLLGCKFYVLHAFNALSVAYNDVACINEPRLDNIKDILNRYLITSSSTFLGIR